MEILVLVLGILGGLCAIMGIITAAEVVPLLGSAFTGMFWLTLGGVLLLACIACAISRTSYE